MAFDIDTTSPSDNQIISSFPASQRAVHTAIENIITAEHHEGTGWHTFQIGDKGDRDAVTDPQNGMLYLRNDITCLDRYLGAAWGRLAGWNYGTLAERDALTKADMPNGFMFIVTDENYKAYIYDTTEVDWVSLSAHPVIDFATAAPDGMFDEQESTDTDAIASDSWTVLQDGGADMEVEVTIPSGGDWLVEVSGEINVGRLSGSGVFGCCVRLRQSIDAAAATTLQALFFEGFSSNTVVPLAFRKIVSDPDNDEVFTYTIEGRRESTTTHSFNVGGTVDGEDVTSYLRALVRPRG